MSLDSLERQARRQYDGGHFQAAIEMFDEVVTRMEGDLGPDHPRTLANSYYAVGSYERAVDMHQETLGARRRVLGLDHERTEASRTRLAEARQAATVEGADQTS